MAERASQGDVADQLRREEQAAARQRQIGLALLIAGLLALAFWAYQQWNGVSGVRVTAPPPQVVEMLPPPPPPPPPPPEEVKPPEPTEQPEPAPVPEPAAPSEPKPLAAPVTISGPAQAGTDSFGLAAGSGGGIGAPGGAGTCLGTNCGGGGGGGGGVSEAFYRQYLSSALQRRVQDNNEVSRLVFTADFALTVSPNGTISGVRLLKSSGKGDRDELLKQILAAVRGLNPPPPSMRFPQTVTVRGRRAL